MLTLGLTLDYEAQAKRAVLMFQRRQSLRTPHAPPGGPGTLTEPLLPSVAENAAAEAAEQGARAAAAGAGLGGAVGANGAADSGVAAAGSDDIKEPKASPFE